MMIDVPYEYIFISMLSNARKYGNGVIAIKNVDKYVSKYLELIRESVSEKSSINIFDILDSFTENGSFDLGSFKKEKEEVVFVESDVKKELDYFIETHGSLCHKKGDRIVVEKDLKENYLEQLLIKMELTHEVPSQFRATIDCIDLFKTIGATYVHNEFARLLKLEVQLEKAYALYIKDPSEENKKRLQTLMLTKLSTQSVLNCLSEYNVDAIYLTTMDFAEKNEITFKKYPIDEDLWKSVPHVTGVSSEDLLLDFRQYAIFGEDSIAFKKLESEMDSLYEDKSSDPLGIVSFLMPSKKSKEDFCRLFYLKLLCNLDNYIKEYDKDGKLLGVKARLMYSLDTPKDCLFNVDDLDAYYESVANGMFIDEFLREFADEAKFLSGELFFNPDKSNVVQKLLLMKTYYDLTKDQDLYLLFESFEGTDNYDEYRNIIFGENPTLKP